MKAQKISELETVEIVKQAQDAQEQLFRFRFQMGMGQFEGLKKYRTLKKDRARMLTVLRDKQLSAGSARAGSGSQGGGSGPKASCQSKAVQVGLAAQLAGGELGEGIKDRKL